MMLLMPKSECLWVPTMAYRESGNKGSTCSPLVSATGTRPPSYIYGENIIPLVARFGALGIARILIGFVRAQISGKEKQKRKTRDREKGTKGKNQGKQRKNPNTKGGKRTHRNVLGIGCIDD